MVKGKEVSEDAPQVGSLFMVLDAVGIHISSQCGLLAGVKLSLR